MSCMAGPSGTDGEKSTVAASSGYCYSDASSSGNQNMQFATHLQAFEPPAATASEIYNLTAGMEMIGFPPKNLHHQNSTSLLWKGVFPKHPSDGPSSSSREINDPTSTHFYHHHNDLTAAPISDHTLMLPPWNHHHHQNRFDLVDNDPSLRSVFTCEGIERPSQGLSLSLSSSNPSAIGLQSFELRQPHDDLRFGPSSSRSVNIQQHQSQVMMQGQSQIRNSEYLGPAQELLNEFCSLGRKQHDEDNNNNNNISKLKGQVDENAIKTQSLYSLDLLELQRRKSKLLQMLEEVDRRYRHYCDQMKAVISSFEAVAGDGAAGVYSSLASRAMSRHFRCLRDGIVGQIKATKKAMGDKDIAAPGTVKGETPRLRVLDQTLRQQRALQQMGMMESHPWRPQRGLPERSVSVLRAWLFEHFLHPYPSDVDKHVLARQTGLSRSQVSNWFINARVRLWKPMVEEMYLEELKENEGNLAVDENDVVGLQTQNNNNKYSRNEDDEKPSHDELVRIDSECLSSLINVNNEAKRSKPLGNNINDHSYGGGAMELDFSSYSLHSSSAYGGVGGGVSLTLGLHQHAGNGNGGGVSLAFSQPLSINNSDQQQHNSSSSSVFYHRSNDDHVGTVVHHHHHHHQYSSLLDSESGQTLPYRNLMGAQLLHDSFV